MLLISMFSWLHQLPKYKNRSRFPTCIIKRVKHLLPKVQYIEGTTGALSSAVLSSTLILPTQESACCFLYSKPTLQIEFTFCD